MQFCNAFHSVYIGYWSLFACFLANDHVRLFRRGTRFWNGIQMHALKLKCKLDTTVKTDTDIEEDEGMQKSFDTNVPHS